MPEVSIGFPVGKRGLAVSWARFSLHIPAIQDRAASKSLSSNSVQIPPGAWAALEEERALL